jgi:arylsulfatase A-like enzyme
MRSLALSLLLGPLLALWVGCGGGAEEAVPEPAPEPARDLVLVTIDTWRGDHFDGERAGQPLTPELSAFADGGVRFTAAHSVVSETSPGTVGFLTGLIPRRSGVMINVHVLPAGVPTMATIVKDAGFATAAVVANPVLRPGLGFDQGFDSYELVPRGDLPKARASAVTDAALAAFDALPAGEDGRRFLWVHYLDPHGPYVPPEETRELFPVDAFEAPRDVPFLDDQSGLGGIPLYQRAGLGTPPHDGRDYMARYAAEVRDMDGQVARLLDGLAERGVLDRAVVAITSDHGEALAGDHNTDH